MNRSLLLGLVALAITVLAARYLHVTGPTYPVRGSATLGASTFLYTLERTHSGAGDHRVRVDTNVPGVEGTLEWKPLAGGEWTPQAMTSVAGSVVGTIPHQPLAAKVAYRVRLRSIDRNLTLPPLALAVIRFRGEVPHSASMPG